MGNTIWVKIKTDEDIQCDERDHSIMEKLSRELDRIAREKGVTPISDFMDGSEMAAEFMDEFGDEEIPLPEPQWYQADAGLATVQALLAHLNENPDLLTNTDDLGCSNWRDYLLDELANCQTLLERANKSGDRFHFAILM